MTKPEPNEEGLKAQDLLYGERGKIASFRKKKSGGTETGGKEDDGNKPDVVINPTDIQDLLAELDGEPTVAEVRDVLKKLLNLLA
jgi:hypothetical protein